MSVFFRFATTAALLASLGGIAYAQTSRNLDDTTFDHHDVLVDGRSAAVDAPAYTSGAVPPSESQTIMGLRVPR